MNAYDSLYSEDWEGPFFDCYDVPFIIDHVRDKDGLYERRYLFNGISLRIGNKRDLRDPYWFGDREEEIRHISEIGDVPPSEDILRLTAEYFMNILGIEGEEKNEKMKEFI